MDVQQSSSASSVNHSRTFKLPIELNITLIRILIGIMLKTIH